MAHSNDTPLAWRRDPDAKKQLILSAAEKLFVEKGFAATRTLDLAKEAGVAEGLIFHHFGNKAAVLRAVAANYADKMVVAMFAGVNLDQPPDVVGILSRLFAYVRDGHALIFLLESQAGVDGVASNLHRQKIVQALTNAFLHWQHAGYLDSRDQGRIAVVVFGLVTAGLVACYVEGDGNDEAAWLQTTIECVSGAMGYQLD